jgi:hypothetical protein
VPPDPAEGGWLTPAIDDGGLAAAEADDDAVTVAAAAAAETGPVAGVRAADGRDPASSDPAARLSDPGCDGAPALPLPLPLPLLLLL